MLFKGEEWLLIIILVILLFGPKRLPDLAKSFGEGLREFKKAMNSEEEEKPTVTATPVAPVPPTVPEDEVPAKKA